MGMNSVNPRKSPGLISGVMLVIATVVGGGMFSLPIAMAGVWFVNGAIILILVALMMLMTGLLLLEVNLHFEPGASFSTFTTELLGKKWSVLVGASFIFVLYILTYAYISGSSAVLSQTLIKYTDISLPVSFLVMIVSFMVGLIAWYSSLWVGRIVAVLTFGKFIAFFATFSGMVSHIEIAKVLDSASVALKDTHYFPYVLMTLPFCIISFGFHGNMPSLLRLYGKSGIRNITRSIIIGMAVSLLLYIFWLLVTMGNISRAEFPQIIAKGGNVDTFVGALDGALNSKYMDLILTFFGNFAVASSMLAATLGLFDYIADLFNFKNDRVGRFKTAVITYLPPAVICSFYPNGFIYAIGYAGLAFTIWSVILPPFLVKSARQRYAQAIYTAPCNNLMLNLIIVCGFIVYLTVIMNMFGWLPVFK